MNSAMNLAANPETTGFDVPHSLGSSADSELIQIVDAALADSARRSGAWLACKPGCFQCCIGVFAISQIDAERLREGLSEVGATDPGRADRIRERANQSVAKLAADFPGDCSTGLLGESEEAQMQFEVFGNDEPCPALDPATGLCDLYKSRPIACRTFGPPVRNEEEGLAVCELCFVGAGANQIAAAEMSTSFRDLEESLEKSFTRIGSNGTPLRGETIIAFALAPRASRSRRAPSRLSRALGDNHSCD